MQQLPLEARQRIHERYEQQSVSQRQLAEDFQVSLSTVKRILKRSKDDLGRRAGSGNPGKIHELERQCIVEYAQRYPDAFLREYADEVERKCGVRVTEQAISVHLRKLKWTLKKTDPSLRSILCLLNTCEGLWQILYGLHSRQGSFARLPLEPRHLLSISFSPLDFSAASHLLP